MFFFFWKSTTSSKYFPRWCLDELPQRLHLVCRPLFYVEMSFTENISPFVILSQQVRCSALSSSSTPTSSSCWNAIRQLLHNNVFSSCCCCFCSLVVCSLVRVFFKKNKRTKQVFYLRFWIHFVSSPFSNGHPSQTALFFFAPRSLDYINIKDFFSKNAGTKKSLPFLALGTHVFPHSLTLHSMPSLLSLYTFPFLYISFDKAR